MRTTDSEAGRRLGPRCRAILTAVVLAGVAATRVEGAAPPGQWWNAAYAERLNVTVTGRGTGTAAGYSVYVTIDHARMVASGRSLASGDDVRVVYWNGGGWVELDRLLDDETTWNAAMTGIWFRIQAPLGPLATDVNYYIYHGNAGAGAPPANWMNVFLFYDDFSDGALDPSRWTCTLGTCTESGGVLTLDADSRVRATATYAFGTDTRWECFNRLATNLAPGPAYDHCGASDVNGWNNDHVVHWVDSIDHQWETSVGGTVSGGTYANPAPTTYERYTIDREASAAVRFFVDGSPVGVRSGTVPTSSLRMQMGNNTGQASGIRTDWVRVRRYVTPEPEATARRESTTVGGSCMVTADVGGGDDFGEGVALQADGKLVVGGYGYVTWATDFVVARYDADFRLDTGFGAAGIVTTDVDMDDQAYGVAVQPGDGTIVIGGHDRIGVPWADDDFAVVRYNPDGTLDTATFNPGGAFGYQPNKAGMVTTQVDSLWDLGQPMVLQTDGKIVLAGAVRVGGGGGQYDFGVVRYNADGSLDTAGFGGGTGKVVTPVGTGSDYANAVVTKSDPGGYILVAGGVANANYDFGLVRYNLDGTLDGTFGGGGKVTTDLRGAEDWGTGVVVQPDGKIVVAGHSSNGADTDIAVVRYNPDGSLDPSFGTGGMVFTPIGPGDDHGGGVALQPDGKIVVIGSVHNGSDFDFAVVRYNPDGSLDTSFGFGGKVTTPIGGGDDNAHDVVLQPDGRIVVVGDSDDVLHQDGDFAMVRYHPDGSLDMSCGQVFYSVGTDTSNLATGSPDLTLTSGTAALTAAQTNDVGVGDVIDYGSGKAFISAVLGPTLFRVQTATGDQPVDFGPGPVSSIKRAFNSISDAVTGSSDSSHLNTANLVALEKGLNWVCYDDGPFLETAQIDGYVTSATYFTTLTAAGASQVASGASQRHRGTAGTGAVVRPPAGGGILVRDDFAVVEWLEVDGSATSGVNGLDADVQGAGGRFRNVLVHDFLGGSARCFYANTTGNELRNSILYGCRTGAVLNQTTNSLRSVTVHGTVVGVSATNGSAVVQNVIATGGTTADFQQSGGTFTVFENNLSQDASAGSFGGTGNLANRAATNQFLSLSPANLHLRAGADAIDAGKSLATFFVTDVDGQARPWGAAWDIGADETALSAVTTYYRSIGTAPDIVDAGPITITAGSPVVTKSGGPAWRALNRGRGDVLIAGADKYMIASVGSDDSLTLATLPAVPYSGAYTIARQFPSFQAWEDCIDGQGSPPPAAPCFHFPAPSASLVNDDRREVGIAYDDSVGTDFTGGLLVDGSTTDDGHTITLTADGSNRHYGIPGAGVLVTNAGPVQTIEIQDDHVTVEWLELDSSGAAGGIYVRFISGAGASSIVVRNNLLHASGSGFGIALDDGNVVADVYNNIVCRTATAIRVVSGTLNAGARIRIMNNTMFDYTGSGFVSSVTAGADKLTLINNVGVDPEGAAQPSFVATDFDIDPASRNNLSSDTLAGPTYASPGGGGIINQDYLDDLDFVNAGALDLHIQSTSSAASNGADLSSLFVLDIDAGVRQTPWDIGADHAAATTAVRLQSFAAVPGDRSVLLEWRTASELSNLGFLLYRSESAEGPWVRLTTSLIPGLGSSAVGQGYSYRDGGLRNGTRYFYRLADVDTRSVSTFHGPVSAVPAPPPDDGDGGADGSGGGAEGGDAGSAGLPSCGPSGVLPCEERYGDPSAVSVRVVSRTARQAVVELWTGGFYVVHEADGRVRARIPGFEEPEDPHAPALPFKRVVLAAEVGTGARLSWVTELDVEVYPGLVPSAVGYREMEVGSDGTVRPRRREARLREAQGGYVPLELARLRGLSFVGEEKRVTLELHPVRWDGGRGAMRLSKRVRVAVEFVGEEESERGSGSVGRRMPRRGPGGVTLAFLYTTRKGLHGARFEVLFPGRNTALGLAGLSLQRGGAPVPFHVEPPGSLVGPGSVLYFYAERGPDSTSYGSEVAYELVRARGGQAMGVMDVTPHGEISGTASLGAAEHETNRIYQPGLLDAEDPWQWESLLGGVTKAKEFELTGVAGSRGGRVVVWLQGGSDAEDVVDHHVEVLLNGTYVGGAVFDGRRPHRFEGVVPPSTLLEGTNELVVRNVGDTGVVSLVFLDRFEVDYPQASVMRGGVFEGEWTEDGTAQVGVPGAGAVERDTGVSRPVRVGGRGISAVDVTDPAHPAWLVGMAAGAGWVRLRAEEGRRYVLAVREGLLVPRVAAAGPSSLKSVENQADYLLIAPSEFLAAAQPLLDRRESQGLRTRAVSLEEIARVFGHGEASAEAIRSFLTYAYHSWQRPSARYVLLLGDASADPRRFVATSTPAPLPALFVKTKYLVTVSDPGLAAVNGEDALPDLAIGRLPAQTVDEAQALVGKLLDWEGPGQGLWGRTVLVADNPDGAGDFEAAVLDIRRSFLSERETQTILVREEAAGTRGRILEAFDAGASLMSYVGHGGPAVWASENVLNSWDVGSLREQARQPVMLTLNCLNGYFVAPGFDSLSEAFLKAQGRGTIAAFSPSGLSLDGPAHELHRAVMSELASGRHERLGDALLAAQQSYADTGFMPELLAIYQLLGDPGMRIR